jgi:hypothetical protein
MTAPGLPFVEHELDPLIHAPTRLKLVVTLGALAKGTALGFRDCRTCSTSHRATSSPTFASSNRAATSSRKRSAIAKGRAPLCDSPRLAGPRWRPTPRGALLVPAGISLAMERDHASRTDRRQASKSQRSADATRRGVSLFWTPGWPVSTAVAGTRQTVDRYAVVNSYTRESVTTATEP